MAQQGHISIHAENILPIIKRWLYSEKDIFLRELVANAADALTKLHKLSVVGEAEDIPEAKITIALDPEKQTLTITDTGIGLTEEEICKYINQVAYSGVKDFVEKYKDKDDAGQVIGHFGLGFYSAFMVADCVEIESLSYQSGAKAVRWKNDGGTEFTITDSDRKAIGTSIILHIADDAKEMVNEDKIRSLLEKYCAFIRYPIELAGNTVNNPQPLWTKNPSEVTDDEYKEFYRKLFPMSPDPLFWIHLNVDYPFDLKGILYFPKLQHELDASQGEVKLYCNQVFVADNSKELIPEFLTLLKGAVDCPDLPLNVSRSYLQGDPKVRKISEHITKKVADKLAGMAKVKRESYEEFWDDIHPFVKFGMMRETKFFDRLKDHLIFKSTTSGYTTLAEYLERMKGKLDENEILYASDQTAQAGYIKMVESQGLEAIVADTMVDMHFLPFLEMQGTGYKFVRVDADQGAEIIDPKTNKPVAESLKELFTKCVPEGVEAEIRVEAMKAEQVPAMIMMDESVRRMGDMAQMGPMAGLMGGMPKKVTLIINRSAAAVKNLQELSGTFHREREVELMAQQIFDLAWMQHTPLDGERMQNFIERSASLLEIVGRPIDGGHGGENIERS